MNRLNRKIEYALIALQHMSQKYPGTLTTAKEVSLTYGCPFDATARVMQLMAHKKLLRSEQGAMGGYQIIRDLSQFSMYDLMILILGPIQVAKCLSGKESVCDMQGTCNIISPVSILNKKLEEFYRGVNLLELLKKPHVNTERGREYDEHVL